MNALTAKSAMAKVQLKWADGQTGVSLCIPAKTNIEVEPTGNVKGYYSFRWMRSDEKNQELYISPGGCVVIEAM